VLSQIPPTVAYNVVINKIVLKHGFIALGRALPTHGLKHGFIALGRALPTHGFVIMWFIIFGS